MKIRSKLTLRYTLVTAAVFSLLLLSVYLFSERNRSREFYMDLRKEGVTKANLFLSGRVDAGIMHSIYMNNREFINEVEVAVYDVDFNLLYHDAKEIDIVKETPEMIERIVGEKTIEFYEDHYQVVGLLYNYNGIPYVVTAAAWDGYGIAKLMALGRLLVLLWLAGIASLAVIGYFLARSALSPVARIVERVEDIGELNLDSRLPVDNPGDELGELSVTFNRMLDRLEGSFAAQKMFVSNVAHELRTPMSAFIGELELALMRERSGEEYRNIIARSAVDARRLERLASGLLDLARASYDPGQIAMKPVRLDELLLDARTTELGANPDYRIELIFEQDMEADDEAMITVTGNEYLLRTAFLNLIDNNCKFSDDRTSYVHISYYGDKAVVRFSDTGIGMSAEDIERLREPFHRGSNSGYASGHGIGMALVDRIVALHKGTLTVNSQKGEGTVFVVELPHL